VSVNLVDASGTVIASYAKEPRRGDSPTSTWVPDAQLTDAIVLTVAKEVAVGNYRLQISVRDDVGKSIFIEPIQVVE
jgi:hypothetical protein